MRFSTSHKIRCSGITLHAVRMLPRSQRAQPVPLSAPADDEVEESPEDAEEGEAGGKDDGTSWQPEEASKQAMSQRSGGHKKDGLAGEVGLFLQAKP